MGKESTLTEVVEKSHKREKKKSHSVSITPSLMDAFRSVCEKKGRSHSSVIEEWIKTYLDEQPKK